MDLLFSNEKMFGELLSLVLESLRMRESEELLRRLAKFIDLLLCCMSFEWVKDILYIYIPFIRDGSEQIVIFKRCLFVSEDEINPLMEIVRNMITLQSFSMLLQELSR